MKSILFVSHYSDLLGANRSLLGIVKYIKSQNSQNPIVLIPRKGELSKALEDNHIKYLIGNFYPSVYEKRSGADYIKGFIKGLLNIYYVAKIAYKLREENISLVHSNSSVTNVGAYLSLIFNVPHVWHFREFAKQHYKLNFNCGYLIQKLLWNKCSDANIAISNALKNYCYSIGCKNVLTIYNGIPFNGINRPSLKIHNLFQIALVGVLHPSKHQEVVLLALSKIVNEYNVSNLHLNIYGQFIDERYKDLIEKIVVDNHIERFVTFYGYQTDVRTMTKDCHIGILASEYEAFGRVTIEYMENGMIPIVSNSGANLEIIKNGYNGFLFELNSVDSLASCILKVIKEYESLNIMIENIFNSRLLYTVENNAKQIISLYDYLFSKK